VSGIVKLPSIKAEKQKNLPDLAANRLLSNERRKSIENVTDNRFASGGASIYPYLA
jgi:hypothetical protein